jgi:hypothetical protein
VTAICTVVVVPTKTGSVLRGPSVGPADWADPGSPGPVAGQLSGAGVFYSVLNQGPRHPPGSGGRAPVSRCRPGRR